MEERNPSSLSIWLGGIELRTDIKGLCVPSLGIDIGGDLPPALVRRVVESVLRGEKDTVEIRALAEASKLPREYYRYIFNCLQRNPASALESIRYFQQFEKKGYLYFPSSRQLLVKPYGTCYAFLIEFQGPRQATCSCINTDFLAEAVVDLTSGKRANLYTRPDCEVSPLQASIVERAVSELRLPYADVARIIRLISVYVRQNTLFKQLSNGTFLSEKELQKLEKNAKNLAAERQRKAKYLELGTREFVFLPNREELVIPPLSIVIRLGSERATVYLILPDNTLEVGKYIATGNSIIVKMETIAESDLETLLRIGEKAASALPEPYRSRLLEFLVYLRLSSATTRRR